MKFTIVIYTIIIIYKCIKMVIYNSNYNSLYFNLTILVHPIIWFNFKNVYF